jgi:hypothetical protein
MTLLLQTLETSAAAYFVMLQVPATSSESILPFIRQRALITHRALPARFATVARPAPLDPLIPLCWLLGTPPVTTRLQYSTVYSTCTWCIILGTVAVRWCELSNQRITTEILQRKQSHHARCATAFNTAKWLSWVYQRRVERTYN